MRLQKNIKHGDYCGSEERDRLRSSTLMSVKKALLFKLRYITNSTLAELIPKKLEQKS